MKKNQYIRTEVRDILAIDWVRAVIETIHATQTTNFSGLLSLLYAGDRLVAGHFGMRSQTVLHYFLPVYDMEMAKYAPGFNLLFKMAAYASSSGIRTIDLDRGRSEYKMRLKSKAIIVADGRIDRRYSRRIARGAKYLRKIVDNSPFASPARLLVRLVRGA
jgi:CelD/BcsL family acetyltransferase involved in cellulose biosynthesis